MFFYLSQQRFYEGNAGTALQNARALERRGGKLIIESNGSPTVVSYAW